MLKGLIELFTTTRYRRGDCPLDHIAHEAGCVICHGTGNVTESCLYDLKDGERKWHSVRSINIERLRSHLHAIGAHDIKILNNDWVVTFKFKEEPHGKDNVQTP